jgi:hypothetical protein
MALERLQDGAHDARASVAGLKRTPLLRLSPDRVWLYGGALVAIGLCTALFASTWQTDWIVFRAAGERAGGDALLDPRGYITGPFVYPPAVAWFFVPATFAPVTVGFWINAVLMLAACAAAALVASGIYDISVPLALLAVFAWTPATQSGFLGQFTPVALLLVMLAILGFTRRNQMLIGLAVGALLYKPTDAIALVVLAIVRKQWQAAAVIVAFAFAWYLASVAATAGDWAWPASYAATLYGYYAPDFGANVLKAVSLPGVLDRFHLPPAVGAFAGLMLLVGALPRLARADSREASSVAPMIGLAASVHAYMYEAVLMVPALLYLLSQDVWEPWKTRLVAGAYLTGPLWVLGPWLRFDPLSIVVLGGTGIWLGAPAFTRRLATAPGS